MMTRTLTVLAAALLLFTSACSSDKNPTGPGAVVASVGVSSAPLTASTYQLTATARLADGTLRDVTSSATWESSNVDIARVSGTGLVTAVGNGDVDIRATYQNVSGSVHLQVSGKTITSLTITGVPATPGARFQLTAQASYSDGTTQDVTTLAKWQSSNAQIADVSVGGYVSASASGEVDIRALYQGMTASVHVVVIAPAPGLTLTGVVTEGTADGPPVLGARVTVIPAPFTLTDERGMFTLTNVPAGRAVIEVSKDGYDVLSTDVTLEGDTHLALVLKKTTPPPAQ
jgi:hypothetical protein